MTGRLIVDFNFVPPLVTLDGVAVKCDITFEFHPSESLKSLAVANLPERVGP